jgi:hypothetical protein
MGMSESAEKLARDWLIKLYNEQSAEDVITDFIVQASKRIAKDGADREREGLEKAAAAIRSLKAEVK